MNYSRDASGRYRDTALPFTSAAPGDIHRSPRVAFGFHPDVRFAVARFGNQKEFKKQNNSEWNPRRSAGRRVCNWVPAACMLATTQRVGRQRRSTSRPTRALPFAVLGRASRARFDVDVIAREDRTRGHTVETRCVRTTPARSVCIGKTRTRKDESRRPHARSSKARSKGQARGPAARCRTEASRPNTLNTGYPGLAHGRGATWTNASVCETVTAARRRASLRGCASARPRPHRVAPAHSARQAHSRGTRARRRAPSA